ncbi:MAG: NADH:ubiquinone reductase (Na(+)-transporting) subunit D [Myxococcota bacterium]
MRFYTRLLKQTIWHENPIFHQMLGICSALAVTTNLKNGLIMSLAVIVISIATNGTVSLLKTLIPRNIRLITEMIIIATFVIIFDQLLKAYYYQMSKTLGPYVGLIITNCIILGRSEAFALRNRVLPSLVDGLGNGLGYAMLLLPISFFRELLGAGSIAGHQVMPADMEPARAVLLAPGAFLLLGILIWILRGIQLHHAKEAE